MKATVKQIFNSIQGLNATSSTVSSLGTFVTEQARNIAESFQREVLSNVSESSTAYKILIGSDTYSEKQLWVIAYELLKNDAYTTQLGSEIAEREAKVEAKKANKNKIYTTPKRVESVEAAVVEEIKTYEAGSNVSHPTLGKGEVIEEKDGKVTVNFSNGEVKTFITKFVKLEVI